MHVVPVSSVLEPHGLNEPKINALQPNYENYTVLLLQPHGELNVSSAAGVTHRKPEIAQDQFGAFLRRANRSGADVCVTPEYSMPWSVLVGLLEEGVSPERGKIWVLGCESISFGELAQLRDGSEGKLTIIFEDLSSAQGSFLDPLAYVFRTTCADGNETLVVLVQFKTMPMGDRENFEVDNLRRGTKVYLFGTADRSIKLATIICSDAFAILPQAEELHERALIIHIQLNPDPRNHGFRAYRNHLLDYQNDETEIICLNWAAGVCHWEGEERTAWGNIGGSAWYTKSRQCDVDDNALNQNHRRGLYYTWLDCSRAHTFFFNYEPSVYELTASKVYHFAVRGPISPRRGPQLTKTLRWSNESTDWVEQTCANDGFTSLASEAGKAEKQLINLASQNPFAAERAIAISAGDIGVQPSWFSVSHLSSCKIDETEVVKRITFCQDPNDVARHFRGSRLRRCGQIFRYIEDNKIPAALADLKSEFFIDWQSSAPHQNAVANRGRATLVNFGDDKSVDEVITAAKRLANYLHRTSQDENASRHAKQRIAVWYSDSCGETKLLELKEFTYIDRSESGPAFDIAGEA
jgi:hypothetical protein